MSSPDDERATRPVVIFNAPPCERSFSLQFNANGELRGVEIDNVYYATVRRKRTTLYRPGDWLVTVVETRQRD